MNSFCTRKNTFQFCNNAGSFDDSGLQVLASHRRSRRFRVFCHDVPRLPTTSALLFRKMCYTGEVRKNPKQKANMVTQCKGKDECNNTGF